MPYITLIPPHRYKIVVDPENSPKGDQHNLARKFIDKALNSVEGQTALEKNMLTTGEVAPGECKSTKLKQVDKYIKNYKRAKRQTSDK